MFRLTPIVKNLLIINVAVYIISMFLAYSKGINLNFFLGLYYPESQFFYPFQYFTYMFAHDLSMFRHILFNMIGLIFIGPLLENLWGPQKFLTFYILTGVGAALIFTGVEFYQFNKLDNQVQQYLQNPTPQEFDSFILKQSNIRTGHFNSFFNKEGIYDYIEKYFDDPDNPSYISQTKETVKKYREYVINNSSMVGASGALYGLLMALAVLFPNLQLMLIIPPIPIKAKYLALGLAAISIYSEFNRGEGDNTAHFAHLGGMIVAFILIKLWQNKGTSYR